MSEPNTPDLPARTTTATTAANPNTQPARTSSTSKSTALPPPSAAARQRLSSRPTARDEFSPSPRREPRLRRRSSLLSFSSIDDATSSFDEIINPRTRNTPKKSQDDNEVSHWHSSPLAFAILPAIGGLLFQNGSAWVTDFLLLGLAAIFMNWSIRLPWDWYYSAQALRQDVEPDPSADDIEDDEVAVETASSAGSSPKPEAQADSPIQDVSKREEAAADLRQQELLALFATFFFPALAAYLLHIIRAQLSGPSTSLVSDYNLSIFLLAAEIRPMRQVVRLIANRTLHLQRTVSGIEDPFSSTLEEKNTMATLLSRVTDLESKLAEHNVVPQTMSMAQKADVSDLSQEIRKRYEPRLEGLERAVRRYEKRSTTMAINTESRLKSLEDRLQEVVSLAAVAAKNSQNEGVIARLLETVSAAIAFAMKTLLDLCVFPVRLVDDLYTRTKILLLGPGRPRPAKRKTAKPDGSGREESKHTKDGKVPLRKIVR